MAKHEWIRTEAERAAHHIIQFDADTYKTYVMDGVRPYTLIMSHTALSTWTNCMPCQEAHKAMEAIADAYWMEQITHNNTHADTNGNAEEEGNRTVYFGVLDVQRARNLWQQLQLSTVPMITIVPPTTRDTRRTPSNFLAAIPARYTYRPISGTFTIQELNAHFARFTGVKVHAVEPQADLTQIITTIGALLATSGALMYWWNTLIALRNHQHAVTVVQVVMWIFYMYCFSGGSYNALRKVPWSSYDQKTGIHTYINREGHEQFASEGYIVGTMIIMAGAMVVVLIDGAFSEASISRHLTVTNGSSTATKRTSTKDRSKLVRLLFSPIVNSVAVIVCWFTVLAIYTTKNPWYNFGRVW